MIKKRHAAWATVVVAGLVLTGCSAGTGDSSSGTIVLTEGDPYIPESPQGEAIDWLFSKYEELNPNVKIEKTVYAGLEKLQAQALTNSLPDIVMIDNPSFPVLDATGALRPLNDDLKAWGLEDAYLPGTTAVVTNPEGGVNGIFIGTSTLAILYNKDMFEAAGITSLPETWDEFMAAGEELKAANPDVIPFMFSASGGCGTWHFNAWQWSAGGKDDPLDSPENIKALTYWADLVKNGVASQDVVNQCQDEGMNALAQGTAAMIENGPWTIDTLNESGINWGSFPIPVPEKGDKLIVPLGGEVWALSKSGDTAREQAAADFLEWSQSPEILSEFTQRLGYVPVQPALWDAAKEANPLIGSFIDSLANAQGRTTQLGLQTPNQINALATAIQQALIGQASPADALKTAQESFDSSQ